MLPRIRVALMGNLAAVNAILEHKIKRSPADWAAAAVFCAVASNTTLAHDTAGRKLLLEIANRLEHQISLEDVDHDLGFILIDDQLAIFDVVSERRHTTHPHTLLLGGRDLVAHALADDLALELGKGEQHVQRQSSHAGRGIELLRDRHERDAAAVEDLNQLCKIG